MRRQHKLQKNKAHGWLFLLLGCLAFVPSLSSGIAQGVEATPPPAQAPAPAAAGQTPKKTLVEIMQIPFAYRRENRSDPFAPFITQETGPTLVVPEEDAPLSGMQLFEPGQLTLVTILVSGQQALAMVEDSTGMGHIIRVKDKIGRRGEVKAIVPNAVVIEEWSLTTSGNKRFTTNEMVLRKEGDK